MDDSKLGVFCSLASLIVPRSHVPDTWIIRRNGDRPSFWASFSYGASSNPVFPPSLTPMVLPPDALFSSGLLHLAW